MAGLIRTFLVLVLGVLVGAGTVIGYLERERPTQTASTAPSSTLQPVQAIVEERPRVLPAPVGAATGEDVIIDVVDRVSPSVVFITTRRARQSGSRNDFPRSGAGSGFIIDKQGHILTNNHVVDDADRLTVTLADDTIVPATVVGRDPANDVAVIKVDVAADRLRPIALGDSDALKVGQVAIAIGNPFGLDHTVTTGIVSATGRNRANEGQRTIRGMIQTDAPINPGNSGGPLLNSRGEVIGINTAIESPVRGSVGIGFAVPINTAKLHLAEMLTGTEIKHPWIGITGVAITPAVKEEAGLAAEKGVYLVQVHPGSPAEKAGLKGGASDRSTAPSVPTGGDVIVAVDGTEVGKVEDIGAVLDKKKVGDTIQVKVLRDGQEKTLALTLAAWPDSLQG